MGEHSIEVEVTSPKLTSEIVGAGLRYGFEDGFQCQTCETDGQLVFSFRFGQQIAIEREGSRDAPIQTRADRDEVGLVGDAVIDGELGQHVFAPELLERDGAQDGTVGVLIEPTLTGGLVVPGTRLGGRAGHALAILHFDEQAGGFPIGGDDCEFEIERGAVGEEARVATARRVFERDGLNLIHEGRQKPPPHGRGEDKVHRHGAEHAEGQWHRAQKIAE